MEEYIVTKRIEIISTTAALAIAMLSSAGAFASDNRIALVPGGPSPYFAPWEQAAADAAKDFGIATVEYKVPAEWRLELQAELLESLAAQGYNGLGIFPGDAVGINSTVSELSANGIPSAALAGCTQDPTEVSFCLGTDVFQAAYIGTKALIESIGGSGSVVHLAGELFDPNTTQRIEAVEKAVAESNGKVVLLQTVADTDLPEKADQKINALLAAQSEKIDGIISTGYTSSVTASTVLRNVGDKRIKFVGSDDDPIVLNAIRDGFAHGTVAQNPYGQGYIGVYVLDILASGTCEMKADAPWITTPQTNHFIDSGTVLVTSGNVASYKDDLKKLGSKIQGSFKDTYMNCS